MLETMELQQATNREPNEYTNLKCFFQSFIAVPAEAEFDRRREAFSYASNTAT